jgi:hypothetical protein
LRTRRYLSVVPNSLALIAMKAFCKVVLVFLVAAETKGSYSRNLEKQIALQKTCNEKGNS